MQELASLVSVLTDDRTAVGTRLQSVSLNMAEALGYTPLDFLLVDRQHGSPGEERLENIVRATDINDLPVVVRVPVDAMEMITYLLDFGVRGIMLPQVEHPDEVREASTHVRYRKGRSLATTTRTTGFGAMDREKYIHYVNEELALLPMVETESAFERVNKIAGLDETTAVVVGPADLSSSLGTNPNTDEFEAALDHIFTAGETNGCPVGIFVGNREELDRVSDRAAFAIFSSDVAVATSYFEDTLL
jgi:4-hydroxy-2-oxoheptanedioate aldolase